MVVLLTPQKVSVNDLTAFVFATIQTLCSVFAEINYTHICTHKESFGVPTLSCTDQLFVAERYLFAWLAVRQNHYSMKPI